MTLTAARAAPAGKTSHQFEAVIVGVYFLRDGTLAAALGDGSVRFIDPSKQIQPKVVSPHAVNAAVLAAAVDIDGAAILTGGDDGRLMRTSNVGASLLLTEFPGRQLDVIAVNAHSGLRAVAAGREIRLIGRNGECVGSTADHPSSVTGIAFHPKGRRLAAAHYGGVSLWWTSSLGTNPRRFAAQGSHIGVTWSPDGSTVMSSMQGNELHGWRVEGGKDMAMRGYPTKIRGMEWLAKPMTLATTGADAVIAWKFSGGGPMGKPPLEIGRDNGRLVTSIAVRQRTSIIAIGFDDGQVAVADVRENAFQRLRPGKGDRICALAWSADGARLAAGSKDGKVSVFNFALENV